MYIVQLILYVSLIMLGLILAVASPQHMTIGIIGSVAGVMCTYITIKEKRNQPRQW